MMKRNDFRYMRQGKQIAELKDEELNLLSPINQRGEGNEHALLILHGFSSSPAVYRYLIPEIKGYDAVVCPILPGHAQSIEAFSKVKAADWFQTANKACDELVKNYKQVDVLGLSLGGLLAYKLSQTHTLHHLYLLAPALRLNMRVKTLSKVAQIMHFMGFRHIRNRAGNILNEAQSEIAYRKLPISAIIEMLQIANDYQWTPPTCAIDLFLGAHDQVVASQEVAKLFDSLPNVHIHWLENSAHVLPLEKDLKTIISCINEHT